MNAMERAARKVRAKAQAKAQTAAARNGKSRKTWNDKCLEAFLKVRPLTKEMDPDVHCRALLIVANATKGAGISAGYVGRFAARLYDQIAELIVKARKYDELTEQTEKTTVAKGPRLRARW